MDFELNEEQQAFADSVRRFAEAYLKEGRGTALTIRGFPGRWRRCSASKA
jgi:hypothetical protein